HQPQPRRQRQLHRQQLGRQGDRQGSCARRRGGGGGRQQQQGCGWLLARQLPRRDRGGRLRRHQQARVLLQLRQHGEDRRAGRRRLRQRRQQRRAGQRRLHLAGAEQRQDHAGGERQQLWRYG